MKQRLSVFFRLFFIALPFLGIIHFLKPFHAAGGPERVRTGGLHVWSPGEAAGAEAAMPGQVIVRWNPAVAERVIGHYADRKSNQSDAAPLLKTMLPPGVLPAGAKVLPAFPDLARQMRGGATLAELAVRSIKVPGTGTVEALAALAATTVVEVPAKTDVLKLASDLTATGLCAYAEPNWKMYAFTALQNPATAPNDQFFASRGSWRQPYDDSWGLKLIGAPDAWERTAGRDTVIAIVDTGIDYRHPDLAANIWTNTREIPNNNLDDDGNGFVDDVRGWDFGGPDPDDPNDIDNDPLDSYGHGTHVAGIAGAVGNNEIGVVGVAYQAKLMAVKSFPDGVGFGTLLDIARGMEYAARNGADVINVSLGGPRSRLIEDAVNVAESRNVVVVASAGNSNISTESISPGELGPVITVGAYDAFGIRAPFSNFGPKIDVMAPGVDVLSCLADGATLLEFEPVRNRVVEGRDGSKYLRLDGTSQAAPYVAGLAAIVKSRFQFFTNAQIRSVLRGSTERSISATPNDRFDVLTGFGAVKGGLAIRQLERGQPLVVKITSPSPYRPFFNSERISISGTVTGQEFEGFVVQVGEGEVPTSWTQIGASNQPATDRELGVWSPPSDATGIYTFRIIAQNKFGTFFIDQAAVLVANDRDFASGWPIALGGVTLGTPAVADLDGDGKSEVVLAGTSSFNDGRLFVLRGNGQTFSSAWPKPINLAVQGSPALADLDGDGRLDIVVAGHQPGPTVYAYKTSGDPLPGFPVTLNDFDTFSAFPLSSPAIADINGDGRPEILMVGGDFTLDNPPQLVAISSAGQKLWSAPMDTVPLQRAQEAIIIGASTPMIGDIVGDAAPEIVVAYSQKQETTDSYYVSYFAFDNQGRLLRGWPATLGPDDAGNFNKNTGALADLDGDGKLEVLLTRDPKLDTVNPQLVVLRGNGRPLAGWPQTATETGGIATPPAVADLNGDGRPDVVMRTTSQILAYTGNGSSLPGFPVQAPSLVATSPPIIADVNGDGKFDILAGGSSLAPVSDRNLYLYGFSSDGQSFAAWPKKVLAPRTTIFVWSAFSLGDLDGDGRIEGVFAAHDRIYAFKFPGSFRPESIPWGTFQQNNQRTGAFRR